jgi:hypothetical protein
LTLLSLARHAVPGGSEEILLDLGIRQAMKAATKAKM